MEHAWRWPAPTIQIVGTPRDQVRRGIRGCKDVGVAWPILNNPFALANVTSRRGVAPTSGFACASDYSRLDLGE